MRPTQNNQWICRKFMLHVVSERTVDCVTAVFKTAHVRQFATCRKWRSAVGMSVTRSPVPRPRSPRSFGQCDEDIISKRQGSSNVVLLTRDTRGDLRKAKLV